MKKRTAELILKDPEKFAHHDRVFLNNPVVMQGMGLAPLVVVATTGQNGLMLVAAVTLNLVSMIEYSAIAGTIGAGGIGYLAVVYGYQRFDNHIMIATIVALIATIQLIQFLGDRLVNRLRHTQGNLV